MRWTQRTSLSRKGNVYPICLDTVQRTPIQKLENTQFSVPKPQNINCLHKDQGRNPYLGGGSRDTLINDLVKKTVLDSPNRSATVPNEQEWGEEEEGGDARDRHNERRHQEEVDSDCNVCVCAIGKRRPASPRRKFDKTEQSSKRRTHHTT